MHSPVGASLLAKTVEMHSPVGASLLAKRPAQAKQDDKLNSALNQPTAFGGVQGFMRSSSE
jgi:hypothetical protein